MSNEDFEGVLTGNLADYSIAFFNIDPVDSILRGASLKAASGIYMVEHGLRLENEYIIPNGSNGDVSLHGP